jgi:hypothetical protein
MDSIKDCVEIEKSEQNLPYNFYCVLRKYKPQLEILSENGDRGQV